MTDTVCAWTEDDDGVWQTGCGNAFFFDTDGPIENKQKFCGYCGGELKAKRVEVSSRMRRASPAAEKEKP